jgi:hypothetical protein
LAILLYPAEAQKGQHVAIATHDADHDDTALLVAQAVAVFADAVRERKRNLGQLRRRVDCEVALGQSRPFRKIRRQRRSLRR